MREIAASTGRYVYVIAVGQSWNGPHVVSAYDDYRFYRRTQLRVEAMPEQVVADAYRARYTQEVQMSQQFATPEIAWIEHEFLGDFSLRLTAVPFLAIDGRYDFAKKATLESLAVAAAEYGLNGSSGQIRTDAILSFPTRLTF